MMSYKVFMYVALAVFIVQIAVSDAEPGKVKKTSPSAPSQCKAPVDAGSKGPAVGTGAGVRGRSTGARTGRKPASRSASPTRKATRRS